MIRTLSISEDVSTACFFYLREELPTCSFQGSARKREKKFFDQRLSNTALLCNMYDGQSALPYNE
jgi:hypothetical protein